MKKVNYLYILLMILPIIDLLTSLTSRFFPNLISIGSIIKGCILVIGCFYVLFKSTSKYKKISIVYLCMLFIYFLFYFLFKSDLLNKEYFFYELNYLIKLSFLSTLFFIFLNVFADYGFDEDKFNKIMLINLIIYMLFIIIPTIFNINFSTYSRASYAGSIGWFYSANEISSILLLLYPFIYLFLDKNKIILTILFILSLYMISFIGTKVTLFGLIIISVILTFIVLFKAKKNINKIFVIILTIITIGFMGNNYTTLNIKTSIENENIDMKELQEELDKIYEDNNDDENSGNDNNKFNEWKKFGLSLLSDRDIYVLNTYKIYHKSYNKSYLLLGMGFSNTKRINNHRVAKMIEIDFLDIYFHLGILALLIILLPFIYTIIKIFKIRKFNYKIIFYSLIILLLGGVSSLAGHVLLAPAVSIYLVIYLLFIFNELNVFDKRNLNNNKISILAMHLGYGGVENAICNIANNLTQIYDVEIISLYKNKDKIPFNLNEKVKVKYLFNTISNRQEFLNNLKKHKYFKAFKEGLKALKILLLRDFLIKKAIINSNAKIIISTRIRYSKLLNEYGNDNTIKIHQEHTYSVSDEYIKNLNKLTNINYIMPVSKSLYNIYQKTVNIPLKYIPLALNYYPSEQELAKLNNYNLIAIGRLEKVKGFEDLIEIVNLVVKKNKKIKLNLFGDGTLKEEILNLINKYNLNDNVTLWGFKDYDFIKEYLANSSLYVMTSYEESFGLVVLEAMSYGVPCIAFSSAEGVKSLINKKNGFIINKRDKQKMTNEILKYFALKSSDKRKYGKEARITSKNNCNDIVSKKWLEFIEMIITH